MCRKAYEQRDSEKTFMTDSKRKRLDTTLL